MKETQYRVMFIGGRYAHELTVGRTYTVTNSYVAECYEVTCDDGVLRAMPWEYFVVPESLTDRIRRIWEGVFNK